MKKREFTKVGTPAENLINAVSAALIASGESSLSYQGLVIHIVDGGAVTIEERFHDGSVRFLQESAENGKFYGAGED